MGQIIRPRPVYYDSSTVPEPVIKFTIGLYIIYHTDIMLCLVHTADTDKTGQDCLVLSCPCRLCEQNCRQVKTVETVLFRLEMRWGLLKIVLCCCQVCSNHRQAKTRQSCLVPVGGVNYVCVQCCRSNSLSSLFVVVVQLVLQFSSLHLSLMRLISRTLFYSFMTTTCQGMWLTWLHNYVGHVLSTRMQARSWRSKPRVLCDKTKDIIISDGQMSNRISVQNHKSLNEMI